MTSLIFVRHGETEWNRNGRWQGHADIPLSEEGRDQARRLAGRFLAQHDRFDRIYASDLGRAFETAQIVAAALGLPVHPLIELREMHIGSWSGLTSEEIRARFPDEWSLFEGGGDFRRGGHGETMVAFRGRVAETIDMLVRDHPGERLLIVTHGGTVRCLFDYIRQRTGHNETTRLDNTSVTEVVFEAGQPRLVRVNDISHLQHVVATDVML